MTRPLAALVVVLALLASGCASAADAAPRCRGGRQQPLVLMVQAVPGAAYVPCVNELPPDWLTTDLDIGRGEARMRLEVGGPLGQEGRITVELAPTCDVSGMRELATGLDGVRRFDGVDDVPGRYQAVRAFRFDGGCVTEHFDIAASDRAAVMGRAWAVLGLAPVRRVSRWYEETYGRPLVPA